MSVWRGWGVHSTEGPLVTAAPKRVNLSTSSQIGLYLQCARQITKSKMRWYWPWRPACRSFFHYRIRPRIVPPGVTTGVWEGDIYLPLRGSKKEGWLKRRDLDPTQFPTLDSHETASSQRRTRSVFCVELSISVCILYCYLSTLIWR